MDFIRPLPRTSSGNQYVLVVMDYATHYPKAYPLRTCETHKVAEKLIDLFSRHGIPQEILTNQGAQFTSMLLRCLYELLGVQSITTSPYHLQTERLVKRFNGTLKQMLGRVLHTEGRQWDKLLP